VGDERIAPSLKGFWNAARLRGEGLRFIFVDKILEMMPGQWIRALKVIEPDEDYFRDHFPGFPVVPGVLLTEMMAQAAGKCLDAEKRPRGRSMLARIKSASFHGWVEPGRDAIIIGRILTNREQYASAECHIEVNGKTACKAELFFTFVPGDRFAADYVDHVLEAYLSSGPPKDYLPQTKADDD
jgi:3-hydroxyacyl-[acyl-carrier-protein] dehydratase